MRKFLWSLGALAFFSLAGSAHAQIPVTDVAATTELIQQVATAVQQLSSLQQQYNELVSTYQQVTAQLNMLTTFANPNGVAQELEQPFLRNPLPMASSLPSTFTSGSGSMAFAQQFLGANQIYRSPTTYQSGQLMNTQAQSLASIQGLATQNLQAIEQRIAGLADLQTQLDGATDIQKVVSINARIGAEQNLIAAQQAQASNLNAITTAQVAAQQQAQQQMVSQQAAQTAAAFPVSVP